MTRAALISALTVAMPAVVAAQVAQPGGLQPRPGSRADETPVALEGAEISEKLGERLPLDAVFRDQTGAPVTLGDLFDGKRPVLLTFYYSRCPMLCSVQLGDLVDVLNKSPWIVGDKFRIVSISMDATETHKMAFETREGYLDRYQPPKVADEQRFTRISKLAGSDELVARWQKSGNADLKFEPVDDRTAASEGWTFLTGDEANVRAVADAVGFGFNYVEAKKEFAHPTAVIVLSPSGKVVSYLHGLSYESADLTKRVISAALDEPTESTAQFLLSCFHFVEPSGFAAVANKAMRYGGFLFLLILVGGLVALHRRKRRAALGATSAQ